MAYILNAPADFAADALAGFVAATTSLGVAFSGCTLPGHDGPLFEVALGSVAFGLGIHGEPGLQDVPLTTADDLAATMVDRLLAERPTAGRIGWR
jgi:dihydroxyacetone kinase